MVRMANSNSRGRGRNSSRHPARRPQQRPAAKSHAKPGDVSSVQPGTDPYGPGFSGWVARKSGPLLVWLSMRPRWFVMVITLALMIVGLLWRPWGAIPLYLLTLLISWLTALSWPVLTTAGKLARVGLCLALPVYATYELIYFARHGTAR